MQIYYINPTHTAILMWVSNKCIKSAVTINLHKPNLDSSFTITVQSSIYSGGITVHHHSLIISGPLSPASESMVSASISLNQCTINFSQMDRVQSLVKTPMPSLSSRDQTAGVQTIRRPTRSKQISAMTHVQVFQETGVEILPPVFMATLP